MTIRSTFANKLHNTSIMILLTENQLLGGRGHKTLNFLILHESNTKKHFETRYAVESLMLTAEFKVALLC